MRRKGDIHFIYFFIYLFVFLGQRWAERDTRVKFFNAVAQKLKFDPLSANNWYIVYADDVLKIKVQKKAIYFYFFMFYLLFFTGDFLFMFFKMFMKCKKTWADFIADSNFRKILGKIN